MFQVLELVAAAAVTTAAATRGAIGHGFGFINDQIAAVKFLTIERLHSVIRICIVLEFDEAETARAAGHLIRNYRSRGYGTGLREQVFQVVIGGCPGQAANEQFLCH